MTAEQSFMCEYSLEDSASLDRIIFHIVSPDLDSPKILMEVDSPEEFSEFFIARISETLKGTVYKFKDDSWVKGQVFSAISSQHAFVDVSERLAGKFQELFKDDKRLVPGVLMLLQIKNGKRKYGAVIKYDDMSVISYKTESASGGKEKPILNQYLNNFVQDKKAIQKSVVFDIACPMSSMICIDRSGSNGDITDKFKDYLQAQRLFSKELLTERLIQALEETGRANHEFLPKEIRKKLSIQIKQAVRDIVEFDPEKPEQVLTAAFGEAHVREEIIRSFGQALKKRKILNEKFKIDKESIKAPPRKIKQTSEGIRVTYKDEDIGKNIFFVEDGGRKIIKIVTDDYVIDDDTNE